ncbi:MAG: hypothetical protein KVP17_005082 [Porospora cf. gigantea B]|uniref:uncharacterized protein n=1 Tax=Porospora cf. gigantea B TaxID=2853592 RepID=UPI0035718C32|nr:MAG: hypothetical protein KVP17_005082 [Porospora cf. gigantea B]
MFAPFQFATTTSVSDKSKGAPSTKYCTQEQFAAWWSCWGGIYEEASASVVRFSGASVAVEGAVHVGRPVNAGLGPPKYVSSLHFESETQKGTWIPVNWPVPSGRYTSKQFAAIQESYATSFGSINTESEDSVYVASRVSGPGPPTFVTSLRHEAATNTCKWIPGMWASSQKRQTQKQFVAEKVTSARKSRDTMTFRSSTTVSAASKPVILQVDPEDSKPVVLQVDPEDSKPVILQVDPEDSKPVVKRAASEPTARPRQRSWAEVVMEHRPNYTAPTTIAEPPAKQRRGPVKTCRACGGYCLTCQ